jgi:hypothetical protein
MNSPSPLAPTQLSAADVEARAPAIAFAGGRYFVAWRQRRLDGAEDIFGVRLPVGEEPTQPAFAICDHPARQTAPAVAGSETGFLVAWRDGRETGGRDAVYAAFLPGGAPPMTTSGFPIAPGIGAEQFAPEIAAHGDRFLVVWRQTFPDPNDQGKVAAVRVNNSGQVIDGVPVLIATDASSPVAGMSVREPAVVGFDAGWVVGWHQDSKVYGARVFDEQTLRAGDPFLVAGPADFQNDTLSVAALGDAVMFGFVRNTDEVVGALAFPNETVPELNLTATGSGSSILSVPPQAYFPLTPDRVEVCIDGETWEPLVQSSLQWANGPNSTLLITPPPSGVFMTRLRASLAGP